MLVPVLQQHQPIFTKYIKATIDTMNILAARRHTVTCEACEAYYSVKVL